MKMQVVYGQIYLITNLVNGKRYVGQTTASLKTRFRTHFGPANFNKKGRDTLFSRALRKYGKVNFSIVSLCSCTTKKELDLMEDLYMMLHDAFDSEQGYNIRRGGSAGRFASEVKIHCSTIKKGRKHSEETKANMRGAIKNSPYPRIGRKASPETRKKMSIAKSLPRKPRSQETKDILSKYWTGRMVGSKNPDYRGDLIPEQIG